MADGMHPQACSNDEDETPALALYVGMARAALEATRIPTDAMVIAGLNCDEWSEGRDSAVEMLSGTFAAMIDAALK